MLRDILIWTVAAPGVVAAVLMLLSREPEEGTGERAWLGALAVGLPYALGNWGLTGGPRGRRQRRWRRG